MFKTHKKKQYLNSYYKPITPMKIQNIIDKGLPTKRISDNEGLSKAYDSPNSIFIDGNRMYIAGTKNMRDVWDDVSKIPFWGDVRNSERYQQATDALNDNPQVDTIISHSLGSAVAAEINKNNNNKYNTRMYGSPFIDFSFSRDPKNQRYRHPGDIISMFDTGAVNEENNSTSNLINPHSYSGFNDDDDETPNN